MSIPMMILYSNVKKNKYEPLFKIMGKVVSKRVGDFIEKENEISKFMKAVDKKKYI